MPLPTRKTPRLPTHDYRAAGIYFITVCTRDHECIFGDVQHDEVVLAALGQVVHDQWLKTLKLRPYVESEAFVVMPNHIHLLFGLRTAHDHPDAAPDRGAERFPENTTYPARAGIEPIATPADTMPGVPTIGDHAGACDLPGMNRYGNHGSASVSAIISTYKAAVTRSARRQGLWGREAMWQPRYHDRIVRNEREHAAIYEYILDNPRRWHEDRYHSHTTP